MNINKKRIAIIACCTVLVFVIGIGIGLLTRSDEKNNGSTIGEEKQENSAEAIFAEDGLEGIIVQENITPEEAEKILAEAETAEITVVEQPLETPSSEIFNEEAIQGYVKQEEEPEKLNKRDVEVLSIGGYTGSFVEDGTNDAVIGVASALVTNHSSEMLQIATLTYTVNGSETAEFVITNLPAGTTALVLEKNRKAFNNGDQYILENDAYGTVPDGQLLEDTFKIEGSDGKITLTNLTDNSYGKVYVYYKYIQPGGAYLGGITFRTPVENVGSGSTVEAVAGHFSSIASVVTMVEIAE